MALFAELPILSEPDTENSDNDLPQKSKSRGRGKAKIWKKDQTFDSASLAEEFVSKESCWSRVSKNDSSKGEDVIFRCNYSSVKSTDPCQASVKLLYHSENVEVTLFRSLEPHVHDGSSLKRGILEETRKIVEQLFNDGIQTPTGILMALKDRQVEIPTKSQLNNFLVGYKKKKFGQSSINMKELQKWCEDRQQIPNIMDQPFVVKSNFVYDTNHQDFQLFLTTNKLLANATKSELLQADATYKLVWQGFPVLIVGSSDKDRVFHPFGIAVCYGEDAGDFEFVFEALRTGITRTTGQDFQPKFLLADASCAITNGFTKVFGSPERRLMCYFHAFKAIDSKLRSIESTTRFKIKADINQLQLCESDEIFDSAISLFEAKWNSHQLEVVRDFVDYFRKNWIEKNRYWYEGACKDHPSTNNGLEATNNVLKTHFTFRKRLPLGQFLSILEEKLVPYWSRGRNDESSLPDIKHFVEIPTKSEEILQEGYQWASSAIKVLTTEDGDGTLSYVPSSTFLTKYQSFTETDIFNFKATWGKWTTFDEYVKRRESFWIVTMKNQNLDSIKCNCPAFLKKLHCKHSVGIAIRLRLLVVPDNLKGITIGQKRKRGRPSMAKAALVFQ